MTSPKRLLVQQCTAYVNDCTSEFLQALLEKIKLNTDYSVSSIISCCATFAFPDVVESGK